MKEEWLMPSAVVPVDAKTTAALVNEVKRLIGVVGSMALNQQRTWVGLTEKEIHQAFCHVEYETPNDWNKDPESWCIANAKYLQAILKEKNHEQP